MEVCLGKILRSAETTKANDNEREVLAKLLDVIFEYGKQFGEATELRRNAHFSHRRTDKKSRDAFVDNCIKIEEETAKSFLKTKKILLDNIYGTED